MHEHQFTAAPTKCYRLRRYYLWLGLTCLAFFVVIGVASSLAAYLNIDGSFRHRIPAAIFFGTFWSFWIVLSLHLVLAYVRERLSFSDQELAFQGIYRLKSIPYGEVREIRWRRIPASGSVAVVGRQQRIRIYFNNYTPQEREELIHLIRIAFEPEIQRDWEQFVNRHVSPAPDDPRKALRQAWIGFALMSVFTALFLVSWQWGGPGHLFLALVNGVVAMLSAARIRTLRIRMQRTSAANSELESSASHAPPR